jgi:hypothetical protein
MRSAVSGSVVSISNFPASQTIAGTVTANLSSTNLNSVTIGIRGAVTASLTNANLLSSELLILNNSDYANSAVPVGFYDAQVAGEFKVANNTDWPLPVAIQLNGNYQDSVFSGNPLPISGTVTANNPSGALTTRFGSVTTANTAQLTSAVTNTSRKYLLVQNIATSTVTIGIGFAPTTTQGIQLTAGAGLTFDAFCPTGGVWWLSSTTGSNFSILEG